MATRDAGARRRLADQVKAAVIEGAERAAADAYAGRGWLKQACADAGTAASAVVLASDLRAPAETRAEFVKRLTEAVADGRMTMVNADESQFRVPTVSPNRQGWRARLANVERLLVKCIENQDGDWMHGSYPPLEEALAEVRAMIDGDGE
jgi:hypothetical protein